MISDTRLPRSLQRSAATVAISTSSQASKQEIATSTCGLLAMTGSDSPAVRAPTSHSQIVILSETFVELCALCVPGTKRHTTV